MLCLCTHYSSNPFCNKSSIVCARLILLCYVLPSLLIYLHYTYCGNIVVGMNFIGYYCGNIVVGMNFIGYCAQNMRERELILYFNS